MRLTPQQYADYLARRAVSPGIFGRTLQNMLTESELHDRILNHCRHAGWIALHSRMDQRTTRQIGDPDFTVLADGGRVFFIECKSAKGKLSTQQQALHAWAAKLGHKVHVVRTFAEFLEVVK